MAAAGMRWRLSQRFRRFQVRWRASRMPADAEWRSTAAAKTELSPRQRMAAIAEACRMLGAEPTGTVRGSELRRTLGTQIRDGAGTSTWLKLAQVTNRGKSSSRTGELTVSRIPGVPMPEILREFEFSFEGLHWHALQLSFAPSPAVLERSWIARPIETIEDQWLEQLRQAVERVGETPLSRWPMHPGKIAQRITRRFGRKAPYFVDEWRTAHGDLNWSNVTAPNLMLLDWEFWGAAPRGFDAATLLAHSFFDPALFRRIETIFADDLNTLSGVVARLYQYAWMLDEIEAGVRDPREHRIAEAEARALLRR